MARFRARPCGSPSCRAWVDRPPLPIAAFAFGERGAILDGNVKRVLARWLGARGWPGDPKVQAALWREAERLLPDVDIEAYTQGLMDLGSRVCTRSKPACDACPVNADCIALRDGLTAVLPEPRPKKPLPQRETGLLILARAGEVMLEKRPPTGIWGGLWSFPEMAIGDDPSSVSDLRYGARIASIRSLDPVEHGFTHFRLTLRPWHAQVESLTPQANAPGRVWLVAQRCGRCGGAGADPETAAGVERGPVRQRRSTRRTRRNTKDFRATESRRSSPSLPCRDCLRVPSCPSC